MLHSGASPEAATAARRAVAASNAVGRRAVSPMLVCARGPKRVATEVGRVTGAALRASWLVLARRTSSLPPTPGVGPSEAS